MTPVGRFITSLMALLGIALVAIPSGILSAAFTDQLRIERENIGAKIAAMMDDDNIDNDEKALLEADAKRLHISEAELAAMIKAARRARLMDKDVKTEFNLNAAKEDPELAFEQFRGLVSQMKQLVYVTGEEMGDAINTAGDASGLEKSLYEQIAQQKAARKPA